MTTLTITENTTVQNLSPDSSTTGIEDTELFGNEATTNYESGTTMEVTKFGASPVHRHTLIKPDLSSITGSPTVSTATLYLYLTAADITDSDITIRGILQTVVFTQTTWNIYSTGNNWGTAGCLSNGTDRETTATSTTTIPISPTGQYYSFDITSWVQDVVDGTLTNNGIHLERTDGDNDYQYRVFASSDGTDGQRPEVYVDYTAAAGSTYTPAIKKFKHMLVR